MSYPWATPAPTYTTAPGVSTGQGFTSASTSQPSTDAAWNYGYTHSTGTAPYTGAYLTAFQAGQNQYKADYARTHQSTPAPTGQILGAQTTQQPTQQTTGGGEDPYAGIRNDINSGWDTYTGGLNNQLASLDPQKALLESNAQNQYNSTLGDYNLQQQQGIQQLGNETNQTNQNQVKTLGDLANNIRNSMMAGGVYLGARGAGDSSAANQYAYALSKLGTQQRSGIVNNTSNILNDIQGRVDTVNQTYNNEKNKLQADLTTAMNSISQWFINAQNTIQSQIGQAGLGKSQDLQSLSKDILNQGIAAINAVQQEHTNRQAALDTWAANNSTTAQQLKTNLDTVANPGYQLPAASQIGGPQMTANGALSLATPAAGYGSPDLGNQQKLYPYASTLNYLG